ncbi:MAG: signal peptidase II [Clostridia bacterium]|nr:signal peptidase II [Clostridia bacterium]
MILGLIFAVLAIGVDQLTKFLVYGTVAKSILGDFLWFQSTLNTGVAFGLFQDGNLFFIVLSAVVCVVILWIMLAKKFFISKLQNISFGLILGGAVGNLLDRIIFHGVRDFIYLKFMNFAIFNFADMCVVVGVILFVATILFAKKEKSVQEKQDGTEH